ncbi:MAG: hypothetical protein IJU78_08670 [Clostridia bacterium]|nr:hypothetical protein [Clostridia bacterium]
MKIKSIVVIIACIMLAAFALGAADALRLPDEDEAADTERGRLIGVFITREYLDLFDEETYFDENPEMLISGGEISFADAADYSGRLYAVLEDDSFTDEDGTSVMHKKYVFEGVEGISFFASRIQDGDGAYWNTDSDEGVSDVSAAYNHTDEGTNISLEGTVYAAGGEDMTLYPNPVYQLPDGRVYAVSGSGIMFGGDAIGSSGSQTLSEKGSYTEDGKTVSAETSVKLTLCVINTPERIAVRQFSGEGELLAAEEYAAGAVPDELDALAETAYVIVETVARTDGGETEISRELYQPEDEYFTARYRREDGICVGQSCIINWSE